MNLTIRGDLKEVTFYREYRGTLNMGGSNLHKAFSFHITDPFTPQCHLTIWKEQELFFSGKVEMGEQSEDKFTIWPANAVQGIFVPMVINVLADEIEELTTIQKAHQKTLEGKIREKIANITKKLHREFPLTGEEEKMIREACE